MKRALEIRTEALRTAVIRGLAPGQFRTLGSGATLYFREQDADGMLLDVFVQRRAVSANASDSGEVEIVLANRAHYDVSDDSNFYRITLYDGESYMGVPGRGAWRTMVFREQTVRLATPEAAAISSKRVDVLPTSALVGSTDRRNAGELHWRIATVLVTLAVGFMAVPLARLRPRQSRYARVVPGVLFYALYTALLVTGRSMLERGSTPSWLGLWWVHAVALLLGTAFINWQRFKDWRARRV
jgi:lipopolysaccharide export system permease protein